MVRPPEFLRSFFPSVTWRIPTRLNEVYLTFDDGPIPEITPAVLDILKQYNAKATFFCIGENVKLHPEIYQRILTEGHRTGNHTQHHFNAWKVNRELYLQDVKDASEYIDSKLFRPPYGKLTPAIINRLKRQYKIVLWDVISYDFDTSITPEQVYQNVITNVRPGSIVVFHDSLKAAERMIPALKRTMEYLLVNRYNFSLIPAPQDQ
jgi:peptidoglycan/xylan/chitin deacetylase (PgdA/CDA1 family)